MKILNSQATPSSTPPPIRDPASAKAPGGGTIVVLNLVAILSAIFAVFAGAVSRSVLHEIEAGIAVLCFITALSGAAIIQQLRRLS